MGAFAFAIMNEEIVNNNSSKVNLENNTKKKHKFWYYFINIFLFIIFLGLCTYTGLNIADQKTGYKVLPSHTAVIVSDSMSYVNEVNLSYLDKDVEHICKNDVIHTSNYSSFDDVKYLDVVIYLNESGSLICHRVIDKYTSEGNNFIVTKGDANTGIDTPVNYSCIRGKVTRVTKGIGGLILFLQSPYFLTALCFSVFFVLLGITIYSWKKDKKKDPVIDTNTPTELKAELETSHSKIDQSNCEAKNNNKEEETKTDNKVEVSDKKEDLNAKKVKLKCVECGEVFTCKKEEIVVCPKCGKRMKIKVNNNEK